MEWCHPLLPQLGSWAMFLLIAGDLLRKRTLGDSKRKPHPALGPCTRGGIPMQTSLQHQTVSSGGGLSECLPPSHGCPARITPPEWLCFGIGAGQRAKQHRASHAARPRRDPGVVPDRKALGSSLPAGSPPVRLEHNGRGKTMGRIPPSHGAPDWSHCRSGTGWGKKTLEEGIPERGTIKKPSEAPC